MIGRGKLRGSKHRARLIFGGVLASLLVLSAGAWAAGVQPLVGSETAASEQVVTSPAPAPSQEASPGLSESIGALSLGVGSPADSSGAETALRRLGSEPSSSATVTSSSGEKVSLAASGETVCVAGASVATCGNGAELAEGDVAAVEICGPDIPKGSMKIVGVEPDGVSAVSVAPEGGGRTVVEVQHNVYSATVQGKVRSITVMGENGPTLAPLPVPAEFSPEECS